MRALKNGCTCFDETTRRCPVHVIGSQGRAAIAAALASLRKVAKRAIRMDAPAHVVAARMRQDARDGLAAMEAALKDC